MSDVDYRPFHYTQVYQTGRSFFQGACGCSWSGKRRKTLDAAQQECRQHLRDMQEPTDQDAPTEELK